MNSGLVHIGSQVQSPIYVSKSQHGGKVPTFEPQETIQTWYKIIKVGSLIFYANMYIETMFGVGFSFLLDPTLNTSPKSCFQKWCHVGIYVILGTWALGPHMKWYVPTSMISMVETTRIDLKWLITHDVGSCTDWP